MPRPSTQPDHGAAPIPGSPRLVASWLAAEDGSRRAKWLVLLAVSLWLDLWIVASIKSGVAPDQHSVYPLFEAGTTRWWNDQPLYAGYDGYDIYRYSPSFAVALTPIAALPTELGGMVWVGLNLGLLLWSTWLLLRHVFPHGLAQRHQAAILALTALASVRGIWSMQSNALVFSLVALGAVSAARKRWWTAALLLAAPVFIKLWPLAAALLMIACWPRRLAWRFAVAAAAIALAPFLTKPPDVVCQHYGAWWAALVGPFQDRWPGFRDVWTIWEQLHAPVSRIGYLTLQLGGAGLALALCLWQRWRGLPARHVLTTVLGAWVCWQLTFGPGAERNTFGLIAPLISWGCVTAWVEGKRRLIASLAYGLIAVFSFGYFERALITDAPWVAAVLPVGALIYSFWFVSHALKWKTPCESSQEPSALSSVAKTPTARAAASISRRSQADDNLPCISPLARSR